VRLCHVSLQIPQKQTRHHLLAHPLKPIIRLLIIVTSLFGFSTIGGADHLSESTIVQSIFPSLSMFIASSGENLARLSLLDSPACGAWRPSRGLLQVARGCSKALKVAMSIVSFLWSRSCLPSVIFAVYIGTSSMSKHIPACYLRFFDPPLER
jgi:hypothetical protein